MESRIQSLDSGIHDPYSGIQDSLGFLGLYMERIRKTFIVFDWSFHTLGFRRSFSKINVRVMPEQETSISNCVNGVNAMPSSFRMCVADVGPGYCSHSAL